MVVSPTGRQLGAFAIGVALGAFCVSLAGVTATLFAWSITLTGYALLFGLAASSVPMAAGLLTFWSWIENIQLDAYERRARLAREYAEQSAVTLDESDPMDEVGEQANAHYHIVKRNLIDFCLWAEKINSLTGPAMTRAKAVPSGKEWHYYASILSSSGMAIVRNGDESVWHPNYTPARAILEIDRGEFMLPPDDGRKVPRVAPCPMPMVVESTFSGAKAKA